MTGAAAAGFRPLPAITRRADFLAANRGVRIVTPGFILLVRPNGLGQIRAGFTVSRKLGGAVDRNRAKRRLREMARLVLRDHGVQGCDHVFIARPLEAERPFAALLADARAALARAAGRVAA